MGGTIRIQGGGGYGRKGVYQGVYIRGSFLADFNMGDTDRYRGFWGPGGVF